MDWHITYSLAYNELSEYNGLKKLKKIFSQIYKQ